MKKLGKLTISPEKIMKNEDLINLQGGYWGTCGPGYWTWECYYRACPGCMEVGPGIVCTPQGLDGCERLSWQYPEMDDCQCTNITW